MSKKAKVDRANVLGVSRYAEYVSSVVYWSADVQNVFQETKERKGEISIDHMN